MKAPGELAEDPETLQEVWDEISGIYTWNPVAGNWDYEANSTKIEFRFPSTDGGTTNDARLIIDNFTSINILTPIDEEYTGDIPTSLNMKLMVGSSQLMGFTFTAQYNNDGIPTLVAADLSIETFTFSVDLTNTDTEVSAAYMIKEGDKTIIELSGAVQGDFTQANIEANTIEETYTWTDYIYNENTGMYDPVEVTDTETEYLAENIFRSANAKLQIFNVALKGDVNINALEKEMDQIYPDDYYDDPNWDDKSAAEKEAAAINKHLHLAAYDVVNNEKLAEAEAYVYEETNYDYTDYWVDFRLKFGDGSLVDLESYFEEGFEDFVSELNSMIMELNSEYLWELELIDY
jgi:hypothetical protein